MNSDYIYRYRPTKCVLDKYHELENQEIYFSKPAELNDPFEGVIVPFFKGSDIHWKALFRFLYRTISIEYMKENFSGQYQPFDIIMKWQEKILESSPIAKIIKAIDAHSNVDIPHLTYESIKWLCQYIIVPYFFYDIASKLGKIYGNNQYKDLEDVMNESKNVLEDVINIGVLLVLSLKNISDSAKYYKIYKMRQDIRNSWDQFCYEKNSPHRVSLGQIMTNVNKIINEFSEMVRPKFRIASFSKCCNIASMWGMYANAHNGICMKLKKNEKGSLNFINTAISDIKFYKVRYDDELMSRETAYNILAFIDENIKPNGFSPELLEEGKIPYLRKLKDWNYEQELRLLIPEYGDDYAKIRYDFSSLDSIIWGVNVPYNERCKMVQIIKQKCKENSRKKFIFYEYSIADKCWDKQPVYTVEF